METRGIAFDFDGTIVDSEVHWLNLTREIFGELTDGRPWKTEDQRRLVGNSTESVHRVFTTQYGVRIALEDFKSLIWDRSLPIYETHAQLNDGVRETLEHLHDRKIRMAVASGGYYERIELASERLGIGRYFKAISSGDRLPEGRNKPQPDVYLKAAEAMGVDAKHCLSVEDSNIGLRSALAAGTRSVGYHSPHNESQLLWGAHVHINHFTELTHDRVWSTMGRRRRCAI